MFRGKEVGDIQVVFLRPVEQETSRLRQTEKPLVAVYGFVKGQAVMGKFPFSALQRTTSVAPAIGERHDDILAADPDQLIENTMKIVKVLQHLDANDG